MVGIIPSGPSSFATRTAPEIAELAEQPGSLLVVPVGSIEQHGDHLPVATDTLLVSAVTSACTERLHEEEDVPVLVGPPVWSGHSPHHMSFGGTLTGEFDTLLDLLEEVAASGLDNGFDAVVFVNGHGGNTSLIGAAVSTVGGAHPDAEVLGLTYFELAASFADEIRESDPGGMAHGGEFETSLMLHCHPESVRDDADAEYLEDPYDHTNEDLLVSGPVSVYRPFDEYSDSGAIGDPGLASAAKGERFFDGIVDELSDLLSEVHERNG